MGKTYKASAFIETKVKAAAIKRHLKKIRQSSRYCREMDTVDQPLKITVSTSKFTEGAHE